MGQLIWYPDGEGPQGQWGLGCWRCSIAYLPIEQLDQRATESVGTEWASSTRTDHVLLPVLQLTYLPPPWGECRSSEMGLDFFPVYSITACRIDCETRYIVENCNCRMVHMPGGCQSPQDLCSFPPWQETPHPPLEDAKKHCSRDSVVPDNQRAGSNIPSINRSGRHPSMQRCPDVCLTSISMLYMLATGLLLLSPEFNVQITGCSWPTHADNMPVWTSRCLWLSSRCFPSCTQMSSTLWSEAKVY